MSLLYIDSSAYLKRYFAEQDSDECEEIISRFTHHCISNIGVTEIFITLGNRLEARDHLLASRLFEAELEGLNVIAFDDQISSVAVSVSGGKNLATLNSIHIASALRFKSQEITFLTYDRSQGLAARRSGLKTLGAVS